MKLSLYHFVKGKNSLKYVGKIETTFAKKGRREYTVQAVKIYQLFVKKNPGLLSDMRSIHQVIDSTFGEEKKKQSKCLKVLQLEQCYMEVEAKMITRKLRSSAPSGTSGSKFIK